MEKSKTLFGSAESIVADTKQTSHPSLIKARVNKITKAQMKQAQQKVVRTANNKSPNPNKVHGIKPGK